MSTASGYPINYTEPRTIWTIALQLLYTLLAMIPFYYYMKNLIDIPSEGRYLLQYLPVVVGILIFFIQFEMNDYYWNQEKTFTNRDIFTMSLKSTILTLSMFYTIFFFIFTYWIGNNGAYTKGIIEDPINRTMIQLGFTLGVILLTLILMKTAQRDFGVARSVTNRLRR
ncbi:MAG: hypothetical protein ACXAE3_03200 [Candidatus Kariarchaeaceae archaeon]